MKTLAKYFRQAVGP